MDINNIEPSKVDKDTWRRKLAEDEQDLPVETIKPKKKPKGTWGRTVFTIKPYFGKTGGCPVFRSGIRPSPNR